MTACLHGIVGANCPLSSMPLYGIVDAFLGSSWSSLVGLSHPGGIGMSASLQSWVNKNEPCVSEPELKEVVLLLIIPSM